LPTDLKNCDVVMEGGITSGIVYPSMVCELAERYRFKSIGGTSAGAIAATLTAAAELARQRGDGGGFRQLAEIPQWLGEKAAEGPGSNLASLFQPQPRLRALFRFATGFLTPGWGARCLVWARVLWLDLLLGLVPGVALVCMASTARWRLVLSLPLGLFAGGAGLLVAGVAGLLLRARLLPSHDFGLCLGYEPPETGKPSLIAWLDAQLNKIAGMPPKRPLTFGDLEGAGITLRMITTCLTLGRPFTLPFETKELYFMPTEIARFFPAWVVKWMVDNAREPSSKETAELDLGDLKPLPECTNLPVIVAARLSLSFPGLFCAVPLYAVDFTRDAVAESASPAAAGKRIPEVVYFSDGGICSNFPLHLFDNPLPRWPTFAISLDDLDTGGARQDRVWMPRSNSAGLAATWSRLGRHPGVGAVGGLIAVIFNTARSWQENLQAAAPGYRDRIVHVALDENEGGLNLNMPTKVVEALTGYGSAAGGLLIEHFCDGKDHGIPTVMTWANHRWVRCRSTLAQLGVFLVDFAESRAQPEPGDDTFLDLIHRPEGVEPKSYELSAAQRPVAADVVQKLVALGAVQKGVPPQPGAPKARKGGPLQAGAPKPTPALRIRPSF
jgi:predicted acylesterase/phospholipase RssA